MNTNISAADQAELTRLRELSARIGNDPLLTQASTGNSSIKLDDMLWIKASGKWMADAIREDILIPLDLADVRERVKQKVDPADRYCGASIETAMHAILPHRVALHVHCVNTIAWAVRQDAPVQLRRQMEGLRWQWIPYVPSGLPLAQEIENDRDTQTRNPDRSALRRLLEGYDRSPASQYFWAGEYSPTRGCGLSARKRQGRQGRGVRHERGLRRGHWRLPPDCDRAPSPCRGRRP